MSPDPKKGPARKPTDNDAPEFSFSLSDIIAILRYRWFPGVALGLIAAVLTGWYLQSKTPQYYAFATVFLEPEAERVVEGMQEVVSAGVQNLAIEINDHMDRLRSRQMAELVAEELTDPQKRLIMEGNFDTASGNLDISNPVGALMGAFSVRSKANSLILVFEGNHTNPEVAALVPNVYAEVYIRYLARQRMGSSDTAITFLKKEIENSMKELERGEKGLRDFRQKNNLITIEENKMLISAQLQGLSQTINTLRIQLVGIETRLNQINEAGDDPKKLASIPVLASDASVSNAINQINQLEQDRELLSRKYLSRHPRMIENRDRIASELELLQIAVDRRKAILEEERTGLLAEIANLREAADAAEEEARVLDNLLVEYDIVRRQVESQRRTYERLVSRLDETEVTSRIDRSELQIYDEARVPGAPVSPNMKKSVTTAVFVFLVCFVGIPFGLEMLDNKVRTFLDIDRVLKKPLLTDLNYFSKSKKPHPGRGVMEEDAEFLEPFRNLYSNIHLRGDLPNPFPVIVTSTLPEEGKSLVATNTAAIFARHDLRTLIVDCDLRRPTVQRTFQLNNDAGTIRWINSPEAHQLLGEDLLNCPELGIRNAGPNLDVLTTGGSTKSPTELLSSSLFDRLVSAIKARYDVIVFDTPPVGLFPDATILADYAEDTVYVIRQKRVKRTAARHGINIMDQTDAPVLGVVLNGVRTNPGSGQYGTGYYSGYGHYGHYGYGAKKKYQNYYTAEK